MNPGDAEKIARIVHNPPPIPTKVAARLNRLIAPTVAALRAEHQQQTAPQQRRKAA